MTTVSHSAGGVNFNFSIVDAQNNSWPAQAGLYGFAKWNAIQRIYEVLYVGQAGSFAGRLPCHERWNEAKRAGMTHVLLTGVPLQGERDKFEEILIRHLNPPLNTHFTR